jgi:hypothetical protein
MLLLAAVGACRRQPERAVAATPPQRVDSVVPRDVELARFRAGLEQPARLTGGASTRDALVRRFVRALERSDIAALTALTITRAEFAYLYYPSSPQARPPYDLSPDLMWFLLQANGHKGLLHALEERSGRPLGYVGHSCEDRPSREGANTVWGPCYVLRRQAGGEVVSERLFGLMLQRDGQFKFVSLANKL